MSFEPETSSASRDRVPTRRLLLHGAAARQAMALVAAAVLVAVALGAGGCLGDDGSAPASGAAAETIAQPAVKGLRVAPESERIDLASPAFSDPTDVSNPLFPVSKQASVLLLGRVDGEQFRTEVTLLPEPRIIEWQGRQVETLVSQYVAYLDGRIHEVAYDFYAQDHDGAVWYFGEVALAGFPDLARCRDCPSQRGTSPCSMRRHVPVA